MKQKKPVTEEFDQWESWNQSTYRTGGTQPPKSHGGIIALLLVLVIFLSGIITVLSLMNIQLAHQLTALLPSEAPPQVAFSREEGVPHEKAQYPLGFTGKEVPDFWQSYRSLPKGIYITEVIEGSDACAKGILPGDILLCIDEVPIPDGEILQQLLSAYKSGDTVSVKIHRDGQTIAMTLILE